MKQHVDTLFKAVFISIIYLQSLSLLFRPWKSSVMGYGEVPFACNLAECAEAAPGGGDYGYYLNLGSWFASGQSYVPIENWMYITWPPGMATYYAFLDSILFGNHGVLILSAFILGTAWALIFMIPILKSRSLTKTTILGVASIYIINLSMFNDWMLGSFQIYSEALSILFFLTSILIMYLASASEGKSSRSLWIISGTLMALAAYTRAVFDLTGLVLVAGGVLMLLFYTLRFFLIRDKARRADHNLLRGIVLAAVTFLALTLPWRIYLHEHVGTGSYMFSPNSSQVWVNGWIPTKLLADSGGQYFVDVGLNGYCQVYEETCLEISSNSGQTASELQRLALTSVASDPVPWLASRLRFFYNAILDASSHTLVPSKFASLLILTSFVLTIAILRIRESRFVIHSKQILLSGVFVAPMIAVTVAPLVFSSFEARYLYVLVAVPTILALYTLVKLDLSGYMKFDDEK